jgi:hypothetical protein
MYKTTIMLPMELKLLAEKEAHRRKISLGEVIRMALRQFTENSKKEGHPDSLFNFKLVYKKRIEKDKSKNHDKYLYDE